MENFNQRLMTPQKTSCNLTLEADILPSFDARGRDKSENENQSKFRHSNRLNSNRVARRAVGWFSDCLSSHRSLNRERCFFLTGFEPNQPRLVTFQPRIGAYRKRAVKHGRRITQTNKPACLKRRHALIALTASNVVTSARVRAEASDWLRCAEVVENAYGSSQAVIKLNADNKPVTGFVVFAPV